VSEPEAGIGAEPSWDICMPMRQTSPAIFSSPHSGRVYPPDFVATSRLDETTLRRSEDAFVDEIFAAAPDFGAPMIRALFPRAYVDPNRAAYELDQAMFDAPLPDHVRTHSPKITAGLGTIPKIVASGEAIYDTKLSFAEAERRIDTHYRPYHSALAALIAETRARFGVALLIDCHSMPSTGPLLAPRLSLKNIDMVLGDGHGKTCAALITDTVEQTLAEFGYRVTRNRPYSGGYITRHYGHPEERVHALQIELSRALYMDERRIRRGPGMAELCHHMGHLMKLITGIKPAALKANDGWLAKAAE